MAKGKNRKQRPNPQTDLSQSTPNNQIDRSKQALEESEKELDRLGVEPASVPASTTEATHPRLVQAVQDAVVAKSNYEKMSERLKSDREKFDKERDTVTLKSDGLEKLAAEIDERQRKHGTDLLAMQKEKEILVNLQAQSEAGFLTRRDEILGPIQERIRELTDAWHESELSRVKDWSVKINEQRALLDAELKIQTENLKSEKDRILKLEIEVLKKESVAERKLNELEVRQESLDEELEDFKNSKIQIIEDAKGDSRIDLQDLRESNKKLLDRITELQKRVTAADEITKQFGKDPTRVLSENADLSSRVRELQEELTVRPGVEIRDELNDAMQRAEDAVKDKNESLRLQRQLQSQLDFQISQLEETERLQLTKETLEASVGAYKVEIESFREQLGQLQADRESRTAFPECIRMDLEFARKTPTAGQPVGDLEEFIEDLQLRMAIDKDATSYGKRLNYRLSDLRIFLAGLAMSKLHLLEGVSGTGKTTLPNAFANAVGGFAKKIEVQAGWRDKQDLLGYYNSFERIYRETPCMQYLYRAGLPYFSDAIIFIVLDEMNLSHPEQYFADFLSALEDPKSEPLISISDRGLPEVPERMVTTTGIQLKLPSNVWFIGTANQDETTFAFAPKTYDRAHVMELRPNAPLVQDKAPIQRKGSVSVKALMDSFDAAITDYSSETRKAQEYILGLSEFFRDKFRVAWGERLDLHISRFVPVNIAAGGSLGESLDHIIATRVLQKIKGKHSIQVDALEELAERLTETWIDKKPGHGPDRTLETIAEEISELRLG